MKRVLVFILICAASAFSQSQWPSHQENVIYTFGNGDSVADPTSGLIADSAGNLYGSAPSEVYELSPPAQPGGDWTESLIYFFQGGIGYNLGNLTLDSSGNLYGATTNGGGSTNCNGGCGTVFELSPPSVVGGSWTYTALYDFQGGTTDGQEPNGDLIFDSAGNIYGTTQAGGNQQCDFPGCGVIFELSPPSSQGEPWTESILYLFQGGSDGSGPYAGLTLDEQGRLYGTTAFGGQSSVCKSSYGCGTVFVLRRSTHDGQNWSEKVLLRFNANGVTGLEPLGTLTIHENAIYGTTASGSDPDGPVIFKLSLEQDAPIETVLYGSDDACSVSKSGIVFDHAGNLYGVFGSDGCEGGDGGEVYELKKPQTQGGPWTIYYPGMPYGSWPVGGLTIVGNSLYGATNQGGDPNCGEDGEGCGLVYSYGGQK